jgi:hypothetical protein
VRGLVLLGLGLVLGACARSPQGAALGDGGAFSLPDSGWFGDVGFAPPPDAGPPDSGPAVCNPACAAGRVCACPGEQADRCGCHAPGGHGDDCDPQVPSSCGGATACVLARSPTRRSYRCSDGREGSLCSPTDSVCTTQLGCVCLRTPFGVGCRCQGAPDPSGFCDPNTAGSCPPGSACVALPGSGSVHVCSDGTVDAPCEPGDQTCRTSLGCTCPYEAGTRRCRCSEPGTEAGAACDPSVSESCVAPLACQIRGDPVEEGYSSECVPPGGPPGGGGDPFACDPARPICPQGFVCEPDETGVHRCSAR